MEVEDTPFTVVRVEPAGGHGLLLTLNDGTQELLDPTTVRLARDEVPYCGAKAAQFEARLTRPAAWQLAQFIQYDEGSNSATLVLAGASYPLSLGEGSRTRSRPGPA